MFTVLNHPHSLRILSARRKSHSDSFYRELPLCGTDTRVDASLNILNLTSESLGLVIIYHSYPHDFHFRLATLTFISHTTLNNLLLWMTLEPWIVVLLNSQLRNKKWIADFPQRHLYEMNVSAFVEIWTRPSDAIFLADNHYAIAH